MPASDARRELTTSGDPCDIRLSPFSGVNTLIFRMRRLSTVRFAIQYGLRLGQNAVRTGV